MSRIGKMPVDIPSGVTVNVSGSEVSVKSSKGELKVDILDVLTVKVEDNQVIVTPNKDDKKTRALWGLTRSLIYNAVQGVSEGWSKELELRGVGYRAQLKGKDLDLNVGQSHDLVVPAPQGVTYEVGQENIEGQNVVIVKINGIDKQVVGNTAAKIRALKPPEPYKGKGFRYRGEYVRRKAGKSAV